MIPRQNVASVLRLQSTFIQKLVPIQLSTAANSIYEENTLCSRRQCNVWSVNIVDLKCATLKEKAYICSH